MTVGYGNHEAPGSGQAPKAGGNGEAKAPAAKPGTDAKQSDRADAGSSSHAGAGQHDMGSPALTKANTDELRAPGSGALPTTSPPDGETDPASD